jgi:hypothetical protein
MRFESPIDANGSFVSSIPPGHLFVFNEIGSFVPKKIFGGQFRAKVV